MKEAVEIKITGKVQDVFFRKYACQRARELNLCGWVKNLPNGSVQMLAEGNGENLQQLINWCYTGSPGAKVEQVVVQPKSPAGLNSFEIVR